MTPPTASEIGPIASHRLRSLDIIRGAVMILMAIDHVRVYSGIPAGGPTAGVFFTRWVTHFCAPAFVFFAGTAAFLHGRKIADTGTLSRYLVIRGLLLVLLELTVIRFSWTFNVDYSQFVLAGVIWMLGWCMVLLAALVSLKPANGRHRRTADRFSPAAVLVRPARAAGVDSINGGVDLGVRVSGRIRRLARDDRALHDRAVDRRHGGRVWLRDHPAARARRPPPALPEDRTDLDGTVRGLRGAHGPAGAVRRRRRGPCCFVC